MKRAAIKQAMNTHLKALGFAQGSWEWLPQTAELLLFVNGTMRRLKLKSGISQRALTFEMGRISGWADILGIKPPTKSNGATHHTEAAATA